MPKTSLFKELSKKGFAPAHVAEVGVHHPDTSNIYDYIVQGVKCTLVEPDPISIGLIKKQFSNYPNVTLHEVAIYEHSGRLEMVQRSASTFVSALQNSPAIINDNYTVQDADKLVVEARTFDQIDDGSIDLLSIDVEGSEWYVIKNMVSRPAVISLETHGGVYVNPFLAQIMDWMESHHYAIWYKTKSDTVFVEGAKIKISIGDKLKLVAVNCQLSLRRLRKRLKRKLLSSKTNEG